MLVRSPLPIAGLALICFATSTACAQRGAQRQNILAHRDIPYAATDNARQCLDLFLPAMRKDGERLPVLAFIHGGGWRNGDKRSGEGRLAPFVDGGRFAGVSIGYRLSGEALWPAQIHDCKAAIRWIRANASRYGLDPDAIAVWGTSAGGHLVSMLGTTAGVDELDGELGAHGDTTSRVRCVIDFFGPTDFLQMDRHAPPGARILHDAADSPESRLVGGPIQKRPDIVRQANPVAFVTPDDAAFLIAHGTADPLVPVHQSELLAAALGQAGVEVTFIRMTGGGHGFHSDELDSRVRQFLARHLLDEPVTIASTAIDVAADTRAAQERSLVAAGARVEKMAGGFVFTEGPARDAEGTIYFSDVRNNRIHRWSTGGELSVFREESGAANGLYFDKSGNLVACEGGNRRLTSITMDGQVTVLADQFQGKKLNSPNDVWIDPAGGIYFTDPRYGNEEGLEQDGFHVYYLPPGGKNLVRVLDDLKKPNGIVGTSDGRLLYVADPGDQKTYVYRIAQNGVLADRRLIADQGSDGMTLDERGNLYLTSGAVQVYAPSGELIETIEVPERPANVCFGGRDGRTLFITARTGFYSLRMNVRGN